MPKIYKNQSFIKWQKKHKLTNLSLLQAVNEMEQGLVDASLGGNLYKKRIAKSGHGKRGSYRAIIAAKQTAGWIFIYGFDKNELDNIDDKTLRAYKEFVNVDLFPNLAKFIAANLLIEVKNE